MVVVGQSNQHHFLGNLDKARDEEFDVQLKPLELIYCLLVSTASYGTLNGKT